MTETNFISVCLPFPVVATGTFEMACVACVVFPWDGDALEGENVSSPGEAGKPSSFTKKFMEQTIAKCVEGKAQCCVVVVRGHV